VGNELARIAHRLRNSHYESLKSTMTSASIIADRLGLRKSGNRFVGACPSCGYPNSFVLQDGHDRPLVFCHACQDIDAVWSTVRQLGALTTACREQPLSRLGQASATAYVAALKLWCRASPASGTLAELYLRRRGIALSVPPTLRFLAQAAHTPSDGKFPAMIAAVTIWPERRPCAVHRTFLDSSCERKASVEPQRMTLGPCRGGAVRLAEATKQLMVGEGIETCLSAMQATGLPAWAALSTAGLQALDLPPEVKDVIVLADGDEPGERAAQNAARRWKAEQRRVRIARAPQGFDFNDVLQDRVPDLFGDMK
jgi:hypothetical protein